MNETNTNESQRARVDYPRPRSAWMKTIQLIDAAQYLLSLHDDAVFICGKDDERKVSQAIEELRDAINEAKRERDSQ